MNRLPDNQKKFRERANRYKRALIKKQRESPYLGDGAGKRYLVGPLYVLAGDTDSALDYYRWYEQTFAEDSGEPWHCFYWSLACYRSGNIEAANTKLLATMIQNIYLLPDLAGTPLPESNLRHGSNLADRDYLFETPLELLPVLTGKERAWIRDQLNSPRFVETLEAYIFSRQRLENEKSFDKRRAILEEWDRFVSKVLQQ